MLIEPCTLVAQRVRLEPLRLDHLDALWEAGQHEDLWRLTVSRVQSREDMARYIETVLQEQAARTAIPFATVDLNSGKVVGSTRFGNIVPEHRRVEIGWTWITPAWQRTYVNTEAKYLMLRHAFETWDCLRVELKTSAVNSRSRNAMLRIGAKEEGTLRSHMINVDGTIRDTVYFSVIQPEWPDVKLHLEKLMREA